MSEDGASGSTVLACKHEHERTLRLHSWLHTRGKGGGAR